MIASLFYFSFIGHFIVSSLSHASLAWALVSFLTVVGIGFFSALIVKVAGSNNLNADNIAQDINISLRYAVFFGTIIVACIFTYTLNTYNSLERSDPTGIKVLLLFSLCLPTAYIQLTIFNFFNAIKKTQYELIHTWSFNIALALTGILFTLTDSKPDIIHFVSTYVVLKWIFAALALNTFNQKIRIYISQFRYRQSISRGAYVNYFLNGLPLALCFGGESLLFLTFSFLSKHLGDASLAAYQASLHFLSIVYMISIGVGNGTGIVVARHFTSRDFSSLRRAYFLGLRFGLLLLTPFLAASFLFNKHISLLYTSDIEIRQLIEKNISISIPFLLFEYIYIVTRMTLRSMGDFWIPTLLTISLLNILGLVISSILLSFYDYSVSSIFISLIFCSLFLMLFLLQRLGRTLRAHRHPP